MRFWKYIFILLLLVLVGIFLAVWQYPDSNLHIIACDVGQGDAILINYGSTQILTDGGPDNKVLDCLGRHLPFWDHEIELIISTHPDADHVTGLVSVLQYYKVDKLLINPISSGTSIFQALVSKVGGSDIVVINPTTSMKLGLGLICLDIVSPTDQMFSKLNTTREDNNLSKYPITSEANYYSIAYLISFNNFKGLLTGDITPEISDALAESWTEGGVEYIKIPHHGSINGITENLLKEALPKIAVISVGKNKWGLPKPEILDLLIKYNTKIFRTDEVGDVEIVTDGNKYWVN